MTDLKPSQEEKLFLMLKLDKSKRRWRLIAIILFIITIVGFSAESNKPKVELSNYIAEIKIEGMILDDDYRIKRLEDLKNDDNVKAVILTIDSPGGAMVPGLELLDYLKDIAKVKPLVVQMKTMAASAGYMISLSGEYVVANKASLTGSVGVLMPLVDATKLAEKVGIESAEIVSGDLKYITSPLNQRTEKAEKYLQGTVNELFDIFMAEVKARRNITPDVETTIADGRVLIGQKAYEYGLVDAIGGKKELLTYLHESKKIADDLEVKEYSLEKPKKVKLQDILTEELTSQVSNKIEMMFYNTKIM